MVPHYAEKNGDVQYKPWDIILQNVLHRRHILTAGKRDVRRLFLSPYVPELMFQLPGSYSGMPLFYRRNSQKSRPLQANVM